ncbi:MAG: TIGR03943 family protein [Verrucomicrobia bacterium Tous-C9LFEB]|nr:MAG: TIGR03943 family protein [Verrucomicrobia bacterium Tous-C9LFEB]
MASIESTSTTPAPLNRFTAILGYALPPATLSAWGMVMIHTWVTGRTKMLLHPLFQPLIAIAGILLLLLAVAHLCYFIPRPTRHGWLQWLILLLPLFFAAGTAPKTFSEQLIAARGIQSTSTALNTGALDEEAERKLLQTLSEADPSKPLPMDVVDLISISGVPAAAQKLQGRVLHLRGQYYGVGKSEFKILRLVMYCCAADTTPMGIKVHGDIPADLKNMDWIELDGPVRFVQTLGQIQAEVDAQSVQKVPTPANPYAY